jgi:hypothetical protein
MKSIGMLLVITATAAILFVLVTFNFAPAGAVDADLASQVPPAVTPDVISTEIRAVEAAFAAREALLISQISELDQELVDRQEAYEAHAGELADLIAAGGAQLAELRAQEQLLQQQSDQLLQAQEERSQLYEVQRGQAYSQYQSNIAQLQVQLDEANAKLAELGLQLDQ